MNNLAYDLKLLLCFDALMAERSVSRAAERLDLSQPAMSHALARLRRLFDDPLLLKGRGLMTPTARALQLEGQVQELLAALQRLAEQPAAFEPATARQRFVIMAPEYAEYLLAAPLALHLQRDAPNVALDFRASDPERALDWLARGDLDFRLGWWPEPPSALRYKVLFRDRLVCAVRKGHPRLRAAITAEDFLASPHVRLQTPRTSVSSGALDQAATALRRTLNIALKVQNLSVMSEVVAASNLIATLPERLAVRLQEKYPLQVLPLPLSVPDIRIALYWHERTHKHAAHRWLRQALSDVAKAV
ncbi:MAG TPA: LysR family transcriptional regulator [Burkholderiales bacterium]|nr:LysR family transcriptional regulator [Burkholderiales bacterium]